MSRYCVLTFMVENIKDAQPETSLIFRGIYVRTYYCRGGMFQRKQFLAPIRIGPRPQFDIPSPPFAIDVFGKLVKECVDSECSGNKKRSE